MYVHVTYTIYMYIHTLSPVGPFFPGGPGWPGCPCRITELFE